MPHSRQRVAGTMTPAPERDADRTNAARVALSQRDADLTVRVANLTPSTAASIEVAVRALLRAHRIGGIDRVGVPLDAPRDRDGKQLDVPRDKWLATRAFVVFNSVERAARAEAALDGLHHLGAILIARRQGGRPKATSFTPSTTAEADLIAPKHFPALPSSGQYPAPTETLWPQPGPHPVLPLPLPPPTSDDVASTTAPSELSSALTCAARCNFCKAVGHRVRSKGAICCPVLLAKVQREEEEAAQVRIANACDRALERKQLKFEAEVTGWTKVGKCHD